MLFVYIIPFQPKTFRASANQFKAMPMYSNTLARILKGQVPKRTIKTIIKIVKNKFFITLPYARGTCETTSAPSSISGAQLPNH